MDQGVAAAIEIAVAAAISAAPPLHPGPLRLDSFWWSLLGSLFGPHALVFETLAVTFCAAATCWVWREGQGRCRTVLE